MRVFVINLDKNVSRMNVIARQLTDLRLPYERVSAVYGNELSVNDKRQAVDRFGWWCLNSYPIRNGEIGCALSHLSIYKKMIESNLTKACILEDDANPYDCLPKLLDYLDGIIDESRPQVFLISNHQKDEDRDVMHIKSIKSGFFSDGYVLTKKAAEAILKHNYPIKGPSDSWVRREWVELYQAFPWGCGQQWQEEGYRSDVTPDNTQVVDVRKMKLWGKLIWKVKRVIGKTLLRIFY